MKRTNQLKLLRPLAQRMVDYPVDLTEVHLSFSAPYGGASICGIMLPPYRIQVYVCTCAWWMTKYPCCTVDTYALGRAVVKVLAHEFRHSQQEKMKHDSDIPRVLYLGDPEILSDKPVYLNDPGEQDARAFSQKILFYIDELYIRKVGRLARWIMYWQLEQWMVYAQTT